MNRPTRNETAKFTTVPQEMKNLNLCRASVMKIAAQAGALLRFGRSVRINSEKLHEYFAKEYRA